MARDGLDPSRERADYGRRGEMRRGGDGRSVCAAEIMTVNPEVVTPDTTLAEAARKMREIDVGILPVVDNLDDRHLQGVITDRDIAIRAVAEGKSGRAKVRSFMTTEVSACHPGDRVRELLHVMEREQVRRVPITDHAGSLVGIVAQADLAVDYAGIDRDREIRVEEAIGRISAPARPRRGGTAR